MAARSGARSAIDATRFTSTTPHVTAKHPVPPAAARAPRSSPSSGPGPMHETPEQRVRRLRAAHLAAQNARTSRFDRVVDGSRRFFDGAQRVTIFTLVGFTLLAGLATTYSVVDMVRYNRKRRIEFLEAQKKIEADELAAARLAFINGTATAEQVELVEEANMKAQTAGFKLPPLLGQSTAASVASPAATTTAMASPTMAKQPMLTAKVGQPAPKQKQTWKEWWFSSLKKEEEGEDIGSSENRLGWESLSEEDDSTGVRESDLVRAVEEKAEYVKEKALAALEREKQNQRKGGALDRVGLEKSEPPKKRWWLF